MTQAGSDPPVAARTQLLSQSRWNLLGLACTLAAHFVTVPFVVRWIGLSSFGRAGLVLAIAAPLTLIGTVIGQAVVREVSANTDPGHAASARRTFALALRMGLLWSLLTGLGLVLAGPVVTRWMGGTGLAEAPLWTAFALAGVGLFAQQMALVLQGYAMAMQDFRRVAQVAAWSSLSTLSLCLGLSYALRDEIGYLAGIAGAFVVTLLAWCWIYRAEILDSRSAGTAANDERRALLQFGKWQGLAQVSGALGNQIDRYALGALAPVAVVGQYNVANRLQEATYMVVMKAGEVLFPYFGSISKAPLEQRQTMFVVGTWLLVTFSATILAPMVPLADIILALWVGPEAGAQTGLLLRTLVLGGIVGCGSNVFTYYAMGLGQNAPVAWMSVGYSIATVVLTVVLIRFYGPLLAGMGLLLASVGRVLAAMWLARSRFFPTLPWREQWTSTAVPILVGCLLACGLQALGPWPQVSGWFGLALAYPVVAAVVLVCIVATTSVMPGGRALVTQALAGVRRLRR